MILLKLRASWAPSEHRRRRVTWPDNFLWSWWHFWSVLWLLSALRGWSMKLRVTAWRVLFRFLRLMSPRTSMRQNPIRRKRAAIQSFLSSYFTSVSLGSDLVNNELPQSHLQVNRMLTRSCPTHTSIFADISPQREAVWRMSSASFIDLVQAGAFICLRGSAADGQSCFHLDDGLTFGFVYLFVYWCISSCQMRQKRGFVHFRARGFRTQMAPFAHKWPWTYLVFPL